MTMRLSRFLFALMGALVGALSLVILVPSTAFACSCAQISVADYVESADLVVTGSIEDRDEGPPKVIRSSADPVTYTVAVDEVLKGESGPVTKVESAADGASCGLEVQVGRSYVIFAQAGADGTYEANLCGGTSGARPGFVAQVAAIAGTAAEPDDSILPPTGGPPVASLVLDGLLLTGAAVVAGVVLRRLRHS